MSTQTLPSPLAQPTFAELFTPKLVTVFREGYSFANFRTDLMAGLTVAIVALPLSMALAMFRSSLRVTMVALIRMPHQSITGAMEKQRRNTNSANIPSLTRGLPISE